MTLIFTDAKKWAEWDWVDIEVAGLGKRILHFCVHDEPTWSKPIGHVFWGPLNNPQTSCEAVNWTISYPG